MVCTLLLLMLLLLLLLLLCPDHGELGVPPVDGPDQLQARLVVHRQLVHWQPRLDEHPLSRRGRGWLARTRPTCQSSGCVAWTTSRDDFPLRAVSSPQGGPTQRTSSQGLR